VIKPAPIPATDAASLAALLAQAGVTAPYAREGWYLSTVRFIHTHLGTESRRDTPHLPLTDHSLRVGDFVNCLLSPRAPTNIRQEAIQTALGHDLLEDTSLNFLGLVAFFGSTIAQNIQSLTDDPTDSYRWLTQTKKAKGFNLVEALAKIADKAHNKSADIQAMLTNSMRDPVCFGDTGERFTRSQEVIATCLNRLDFYGRTAPYAAETALAARHFAEHVHDVGFTVVYDLRARRDLAYESAKDQIPVLKQLAKALGSVQGDGILQSFPEIRSFAHTGGTHLLEKRGVQAPSQTEAEQEFLRFMEKATRLSGRQDLDERVKWIWAGCLSPAEWNRIIRTDKGQDPSIAAQYLTDLSVPEATLADKYTPAVILAPLNQSSDDHKNWGRRKTTHHRRSVFARAAEIATQVAAKGRKAMGFFRSAPQQFTP
jgi:hypothetical protein